MRLCFDATRFGSGLEGSIELAAGKGIEAIEYSFAPFSTTGRGGRDVKGKELEYLQSMRALLDERGVEIACLNLDYLHSPGDKKSAKRFLGMMEKLIKVAALLGCPRVSFLLSPGVDDSWKEAFESEYAELLPIAESHEVRMLLRLSTPSEYRGLSLKLWKTMEPQDWRDLVSTCPNLSLSFSPGDCVWLGINYLAILPGITSAIEHIEALDVEVNRDVLSDSGMFGPLWWRYRLVGKGSVDWRQLIEALKLYDYQGTFSIHLDDEFVDSDVNVLNDALDEGIRTIAPLLKG